MKLTLIKFSIIIFTATLCSILFFLNYSRPYKAVVTVPIADIIDHPIQTTFPDKSVEDGYNSLPLCGGEPKSNFACPRMHQLLFNEIVEVVEERNEEVKIKIPHFFYVTEKERRPQHTFWTMKRSLVPLSEFEKKGLNTWKIPPPIRFDSKDNSFSNVVALTMPFFDQKTKTAYSAGTRFVLANDTFTVNNEILVYAYEPQTASFNIISIPASILIKPHTEIKR